MSVKKTFYITTPIYYPSGKWHLGTCYSTVLADCLARYHKSLGEDVFFMTGTDEHGQKIAEKAAEQGLKPMAYIDPIVADLKEIWELLDVKYDKFIRTTDKVHEKAVAQIFEKLLANGDVYLGKYEGHYCVPCESYWTESQLDGARCCPDCHRPVESRREESYFFRLSKYQKQIERLFTREAPFLEPESRRNEMLNNFIKPGLVDVSVTRTSLEWGIPVQSDPKHTIYVWIDALLNYVTGLGYDGTADGEGAPLFKKFWRSGKNARVLHIMAKEIVRFHAIIWPALLWSLGIALPTLDYAHGWMLFGGDKMSKSKGNLADPREYVAEFGKDAVRYCLLKSGPLKGDTNFTRDIFVMNYNTDLVNTLGNLVSRTAAMTEQYFGGVRPKTAAPLAEPAAEVEKAMLALDPPAALTVIFDALSATNKYIDDTKPWILAKTDRDKLETVIATLIATIEVCAAQLAPFMPETSKKIAEIFSGKITKREPIFARYVEEPEGGAPAAENALSAVAETAAKGEITIEEFDKIELLVAKVITAEKVDKSDKLLKFHLDDGTAEGRTVLSGIAKFYTAEEMAGKSVVIVANLKPRKMMGFESKGMILCAADGEKLKLIAPTGDFKPRTRIG